MISDSSMNNSTIQDLGAAPKVGFGATRTQNRGWLLVASAWAQI